MTKARSLTGVWNGMYTYTTEPDMPESHFTAVLLDTGGSLSGTIHETMNYGDGVGVDANAHIDGRSDYGAVDFVKTYDGTGGVVHSVVYTGTVTSDFEEIEGEWQIATSWEVYAGRFLMIRASRPAAEAQAVMEEAMS